MTKPGTDPKLEFSFGRLVAKALGFGALALVIFVPFIFWVAHYSSIWGLVLALTAIAAMLAVIVFVSKREMRPIQQAIDEKKAQRAARAAKTDNK